MTPRHSLKHFSTTSPDFKPLWKRNLSPVERKRKKGEILHSTNVQVSQRFPVKVATLFNIKSITWWRRKKKNRIPLRMSSTFVVSHRSIQFYKKNPKNWVCSCSEIAFRKCQGTVYGKTLKLFHCLFVLLRLHHIGWKVKKQTVALSRNQSDPINLHRISLTKSKKYF